MKNKIEKYLHIYSSNIPLYRGKFVVIITNNRDELIEILPEFTDEEIYGHTILSNWKGHQAVFAVFNFHNPFRPMTQGVITHESIHFASAICGDRAILADHDNDEAFAYLAEWAADQIWSVISKHGFRLHVKK